jgi:hypothetical protein
MTGEITYYYEQSGHQAGPVAANQLLANGVTATTLVWHDGIPTWVPAATLPALATLFLPPPLPTRVPGAPQPPAGSDANQPFQLVQPTPLSLTPGQTGTAHMNQAPRPAVTTFRPQFSAGASKYRWWHYLLLAVVIMVLMLLGRACGVVLGHAFTVRGQILLPGNMVAMSAACFTLIGHLSTAG